MKKDIVKGKRSISEDKQRIKSIYILKSLLWLVPILLGAYFFYAPKVSLQFHEPLSKNRPFLSPFELNNKGNSSISTLALDTYSLDDLVFNSIDGRITNVENLVVHRNTQLIDNLNANSSYTFVIDFGEVFQGYNIPLKLSSARGILKIYISYYWLFIRQEEIYSFRIITFEDNTFKWVSVGE